MKTQVTSRRARLGTAVAALAIALGTVGAAAPAVAQPSAARPAETIDISKGTGTLVRLSEPMSDVFVANDTVADVQVRSPTQLYVFGKGSGETTIYATSKSGRVVYATNVRVAQNLANVNEIIHAATLANAAANGVEVRAERFDLLRDGPAPTAPTVAANLLRPLLLAVARAGFGGEPPRTLIASGLLRHEAGEIAAAFAAHGLRELGRRETAEWAAVLLVRPA